MKGLTFEVIFGKFAGFYLKKSSSGSYRICFGWIAISLYLYDRDIAIGNLTEKLNNLKSNLEEKNELYSREIKHFSKNGEYLTARILINKKEEVKNILKELVK